MIELNKIHEGDFLINSKILPDNSIDCCITSPPYFGLRDYGHEDQIGLEATPELYVEKLVKVFNEVKRVLKKTGTLWLNLGDSYAGGAGRWGGTENLGGMQGNHKGSLTQGNSIKWKHETIKQKDLIGIPWMVAFALRSAGWYLRQDIIWAKPNPMPESVTDRCTKAHEYIFLLSKSSKYYYDNEAIKTLMECSEHDKRAREGRKRSPTKLIAGIRGGNDTVYEYANKRSVWTITTKPYAEAHFATYPQELIEDMVKAGCNRGGVILDPFMGAGTTAVVARKLERNYIGFELNPEYIKIAEKRIFTEIGLFL